MTTWLAIVAAFNSLGFSPGELLSIGSVWVAIARHEHRVKLLEAAHSICPHVKERESLARAITKE